MNRWATFDCYGTLIDWNGGIGRELERLFGADQAGSMLTRYHEQEREVQREDPARRYRDVMTIAVGRLGAPSGEEAALAESLPQWQPFPEVRASLEDVRRRGWKLAILSNTDRDYIDASMQRIGVPFEMAIVASEIGSYKPSRRHWEEFAARVTPDVHIHVGASLFHDVAPAIGLGLPTVWINRGGEHAEPEPDVELHSLSGLGDVLDGLA